MSETNATLEQWEAQGKELASNLRTELKELDARRNEILETLARIEGRSATPSTQRVAGTRSECGRLTRMVVKEAYPQGLPADEIIASVQAEATNEIARATILTHLSRAKAKGTFRVEGETGSFTYFWNETEEGQ